MPRGNRTARPARVNPRVETPRNRARATASHRPRGPVHRVFISYKREDQAIANAIKLAVETLAFGRVVCFFDQQIKPGDHWAKTINTEIDKANWFILIYTGRADYENCIYEAVYYEASRGAQQKDHKPRPLICLHDTESVPDALKKYQNYHVVTPEAKLGTTTLSVTSTERGHEFYKRSGCYKFLNAFVAICNPNAQRSQSFPSQLLALSHEITTAFLNAGDPSIDDKVRHPRVSLEFENATIEEIRAGTLQNVPVKTKVRNASDTNALALLGVTEDSADWETIRHRFQKKQMSADVGWMEEAETAILSAIRGETIPTIDLAIRALSDPSGSDIYRCVLSRQKEYRSGRQKLYLLFVRTRDRRLANDEQMALLLALQIMTTRFRFEVLKGPWSFTHNANPAAIDRQARQFLRLISKAECEATEYGMSDALLKSAFDKKNYQVLKTIGSQWYKDKEKLEKSIMSGKAQDQVAKINAFIASWLPKNLNFLKLVTNQYLERLQVEHEK